MNLLLSVLLFGNILTMSIVLIKTYKQEHLVCQCDECKKKNSK